MISFVVFSFKRAWQGFFRNGLMSVAATATMVLMLLLLAGFWILQSGLVAGLEFTKQKVNVIAYIENRATPTEIGKIEERIGAMPEVHDITLVSRDEALERFRTAQAAQGREDLTGVLDTNPLYASLEVNLTDPTYARVVREALEDEPMIRNVLDIQALADNVVTVTSILQTAGTVVLVVIGLIVLFIIVNTIRLAVFARAEEIEIMRLVGASDAFIRWPFVFEGALVGLLGAGISLALLWLTAEPIGSFMVDFFRVLPLTFGTLARDVALLVLGTGVGLGVLGSWLSVRTYLIK